MMRLLLSVLCFVAAVSAQDVLVIAPKRLQSSLADWKKHRARQGHKLVVEEPSADMRAQVLARHKASGGKLRFIVLVGDVKDVPCRHAKGVIIAPYERDPRIANDNYLADLDGDSIPELAVGRIPADNAKEARALLARAIAYENSRDFSAWRRRVNVIAGVAGFSKFQDAMIEKVTAKFLAEKVPPAYDLHVTYANPNSSFCPPPTRLTPTVLTRFNEGALIVAYIGHGSRQRLDRMRFGARVIDIFTEDDAYSIRSTRGAPIVFFNACLTGHFDGAPDCLSEVMLRQERGPIAIISASRVSMPYANAIMAKELLEALFHERVATTGEALLLTKQRLMNPKPGDEDRKYITLAASVAWQWDPKKLEQERKEHLALYNLLGDPLVRIPHPEPAQLLCAEEAVAGSRLTVEVKASVSGKAVVELIAERTSNVAPRKSDSQTDFQACYERSNQWVRARTDTKANGTSFTLELALPQAPGNYDVRVWIQGERAAAMGSRRIVVNSAATRNEK